MTRFFVAGVGLQRRAIDLGAATFTSGAAGIIHPVVGERGVLVKLYRNSGDLGVYREKIAAMLAAPPHLLSIPFKGRNCVQIAWPTASVTDGREFRGFMMPEIDLQASTELENMLQKGTRLHERLPEFYGTRVLLAANLAALMAELHVLGHYMIDMKPINMRCYPDAGYMAILDTDGFSINGRRRFPSLNFSDEYIAPEAQGKSPDQLGIEQDLFALAVIIFRLLNNGFHPYQGVDNCNQPTTLQERIFAGLYAYGLTGHARVRPAPRSLHGYLEDGTRELFDRAFRAKGTRPAAAMWRDHLHALITNKTLVKCTRDPINHAHFSRGCGLCGLQTRSAARVSARQQSTQMSSSVLGNLLAGGAGSSPVQSRTSPPLPGRPRNLPSRIIGLTLGVAVLAAVVYGGHLITAPFNVSPVPAVGTAGKPPIASNDQTPPGVVDGERPPPPQGGPVTQKPDRELVRAVQHRMQALGFSPGPVDGAWGRRTEAAVKSFQQAAGRKVTAALDRDLIQALDAALDGSLYVSYGIEETLIGKDFSNRLRGSLKPSDLPKLLSAYSFALGQLGPGETVTWRNPETGHGGRMTVGERLNRQGKICRPYDHEIEVSGRTELARAKMACHHDARGVWILVEHPISASADGQRLEVCTLTTTRTGSIASGTIYATGYGYKLRLRGSWQIKFDDGRTSTQHMIVDSGILYLWEESDRQGFQLNVQEDANTFGREQMVCQESRASLSVFELPKGVDFRWVTRANLAAVRERFGL